MLLGRNAAVLLREKVSAIQSQTHAQLITPAQALSQLQTLGIPQSNAQALVALAASTITPAADVGKLEPI